MTLRLAVACSLLMCIATLVSSCSDSAPTSRASRSIATAPVSTATSVSTAAPAGTAAAPSHIVAISAGHGGPNNIGAVHTNARGETDLIEKDLNLDIAQRLDALLRADGYRTVMIRDGDYSLATASGSFSDDVRAESQARADKANEAGAEIILAIHHNGSEDGTQSGTEAYFNPDRTFGEASGVLATSVYNGILARLHQHRYDSRPRGVMDDRSTAAAQVSGGHTFLLGDAPGFRATQMPGAIVEALFISNDTEAALLQGDEIRSAIAQGYKDGIDAYFTWQDALP